MTKIQIKIGDVFSVKINSTNKKYFQYLGADLTQLNSDVIRTFEKTYSSEKSISLAEIINGEIQFHAHVFLRLGIKMGYWERVGNVPYTENIKQILFRDTDDYGHKIGEKPVKSSTNWFIWRTNDYAVEKVGKLEGENKNAEIGIVVSPEDIVIRMCTGKYDFVYPDFE